MTGKPDTNDHGWAKMARASAARPTTTPDIDRRSGRVTKTARLREMLSAPAGASIEEIGAAMGWQVHSVRAALSMLRKAGAEIERIAPGEADTAARYRLAAAEGGRQ